MQVDRIYTGEGLFYTQPKTFWVGTPQDNVEEEEQEQDGG
jgi:hypothetical protein